MANIVWKDQSELDSEHRVALKDYANHKRNEIERVGFNFEGNRFQSDQDSFNRLIGTAMLVASGQQLPPGFAWRTSDNKNVPVTGTEVQGLLAAVFTQANLAHKTLQEVKASIEAGTITTTTEIDAAPWPT